MEDYRKFTALDFLTTKSMNTTILTGILVVIVLSACTNPKKASKNQNDKDDLAEKQIGAGNYYISLPKNYTIKETKGPDFSVYYFRLNDTTRNALSGGIYFGNYP